MDTNHTFNNNAAIAPKGLLYYGVVFFLFFALSFLIYLPTHQSFFDAQEFESFLIPLKTGIHFYDYVFRSYSWKVGDERRGFFRPLLSVLFFVEYTLWGDWPVPYRMFSLLLHVLTALLVALLCFLLTDQPFISLSAGLFFLVHPTVSSAITILSCRGEVIATFFILLSLFLTYVYLHKKFSYPILLLICCSSLLSISGKELGFTVFIILPVFFFLLPGGQRSIKKALYLVGSLMIVFVFEVSVRFALFGNLGGYGHIKKASEALGSLSTLYGKFLLFDKFDLISVHYVLLFALFSIFLNYIGAVRKGWVIFLLFFIMVITSSFQSIVARDSPHYSYLPTSIFILFFFISLSPLMRSGKLWRMISVMVLTVLFCILGSQTYDKNKRDAEKVFYEDELVFQSLKEQQNIFRENGTYYLIINHRKNPKNPSINSFPKVMMFHIHYLLGHERITFVHSFPKDPAEKNFVIWDGEKCVVGTYTQIKEQIDQISKTPRIPKISGKITVNLRELKGRKESTSDNTIVLTKNTKLRSHPYVFQPGKYEIEIIAKSNAPLGEQRSLKLFVGKNNCIGRYYGDTVFSSRKFFFSIDRKKKYPIIITFINNSGEVEETNNLAVTIKSITVNKISDSKKE